MSDSHYSPVLFEEDAARVVDILMESRRPEHVGFSEHLHILDVQRDSNQFRDEIDVARHFDRFPVLSLDDGSRLPISVSLLSAYLAEEVLGYYPIMPRRFTIHMVEEAMYHFTKGHERLPEGVSFAPVEEARTLFRSRAITFVSLRMSVTRKWEHGLESLRAIKLKKHIKGRTEETPVCSLEFRTNTVGLRVLQSGAYFMSPIPRVVGAPTSPLHAELPPGTYMFGVDQGPYGNSPNWDHASLAVPCKAAVHLNF